MSTTTLNPSPAAEPSASLSFRLLERDLVPDPIIRSRIRALLAERLREERKSSEEAQQQHFAAFIEQLKSSPIAISTQEANEQHYELPCEFFEMVLGKHLKYSSAYYRRGVTSLDQAEADMLALTCQRARLTDGDVILELGCGWGSLTLWMAKHFPKSRITAVSNSRTQKQFIEARAKAQGLDNVEVITCDMNVLDLGSRRFDRVVSVEMFEHMRNYEQLLGRVVSWMQPAATLFVHIFTHREYAYPFEVRLDGEVFLHRRHHAE
jgi:cyclopropane-fatty-acyl-phospholipid synthase